MQSRETNEEFAREQENANKGWETCYGAALKTRLKWIDQMLMEGTDEVPGLRHIPGVQVFLDSEDTVDRDLISAIGINGIDFTQLTAEYYKRGITVFERVNTSLYSKRIVESLGLTGAIRVSPLHCHSTKDIEDFLRVTADIAATVKA